MQVKQISICLHAQEKLEHIVEKQKNLLKPLEKFFEIDWNLRIVRHPKPYDSYSELVNDSIISSKYEHIVMLNARVIPNYREVIDIISMLETGYAAVCKYSVAYMGVTKELFRKIGWWDERYIGGGYEDDDFYMRLRLADLAVYDSHEAIYDYTWKQYHGVEGGDKCSLSEPHFFKKWKFTEKKIFKMLKEEDYKKYEFLIGDNNTQISSKWLPWEKSNIGTGYGINKNKEGIPSNSNVLELHGFPRSYRFQKVSYADKIVGENKEIINCEDTE